MINGGFEETLERNGHARGDVKSKCFSACLHVRFSAEVLGGRSTHGGFSYLPSNPQEAWAEVSLFLIG